MKIKNFERAQSIVREIEGRLLKINRIKSTQPLQIVINSGSHTTMAIDLDKPDCQYGLLANQFRCALVSQLENEVDSLKNEFEALE